MQIDVSEHGILINRSKYIEWSRIIMAYVTRDKDCVQIECEGGSCTHIYLQSENDREELLLTLLTRNV